MKNIAPKGEFETSAEYESRKLTKVAEVENTYGPATITEFFRCADMPGLSAREYDPDIAMYKNCVLNMSYALDMFYEMRLKCPSMGQLHRTEVHFNQPIKRLEFDPGLWVIRDQAQALKQHNDHLRVQVDFSLTFSYLDRGNMPDVRADFTVYSLRVVVPGGNTVDKWESSD
jgi:hypothetical protein